MAKKVLDFHLYVEINKDKKKLPNLGDERYTGLCYIDGKAINDFLQAADHGGSHDWVLSVWKKVNEEAGEEFKARVTIHNKDKDEQWVSVDESWSFKRFESNCLMVKNDLSIAKKLISFLNKVNPNQGEQ